MIQIILLLSILAYCVHFLSSSSSRYGSIMRRDEAMGAVFIMVKSPWSAVRQRRRCCFNATMDALRKHWLPWNNYPIYLLSDKSWMAQDKYSISKTWPYFNISFVEVNKQFLIAPTNRTYEDRKKPLGKENYKRMIAFSLHGFTHVSQLRKFRYLMRLDDDACILDPIQFDIFKRMQAEKITYAYKQIFLDPKVYVVGLDAFAESYMRDNGLKWSNVPLRQQAKRLIGGHLLSFSTNLEALDMNKYRSTDNKRFIHAVIQSNNIYHRRWGDAPLRFLQAQMFYSNEEVMKFCEFGYQHSTWPVSERCANVTQRVHVYEHVKENMDLRNAWMN